ncbi:transcription termination factor 2 [Anopheles nili]|uniref:transcription termination factor 2 n=1 Tax=Anopheles nili TaxID=185578 RepID=UPI00237B2BC9|nr:transcription termination factor 2 [Anopheles nili]
MSADSFYVEDSAEEDSYKGEQTFRKNIHMESVVIEETDSEAENSHDSMISEEESVQPRMKNRQSMRMSLHPKQTDSDSSEESETESSHGSSSDRTSNTDEENDAERSVYSPVTRRSIFGPTAKAVYTDEDDNLQSEDSDDEQIRGRHRIEQEILSDGEPGEQIAKQMKRKSRKAVQILSDSDTEDENPLNSGKDGGSQNGNSFDASLSLRKYNPEDEPAHNATKQQLSFTFQSQAEEQDSISTKLSSTLKSGNELDDGADESSVLSPAESRHSISLRASIGEKLSSTQIRPLDVEEVEERQLDVEKSPQKSRDESSSVELVEKSAEILSVSSDEEVIPSARSRSQIPSLEPPAAKTAPQVLVQPTITAFVRRSGHGGVPERVSQSEYDANIRRMADLKSQLVLIEGVMKNRAKLPDQGAGLVRRLAEVKSQIFELSKNIDMTRATPSKGIKNAIRKNFDQPLQSLDNSRNSSANSSAGGPREHVSWDTIKKATDDIQPRHTGKQGMATFENQKLLTMDRLATLHKSIEACPTEDTLADPPKLLKVELMNHQRHALAWMLWRESQKPHGGILADDMGLGKTLSMISLVLKSAELDPDGEQLAQNSDSEDEENRTPNGNGGWMGKGRKDYFVGGTLIVCPASLMRQWEGEVAARVKRNSLDVYVHHGTNRETKPRKLAKYDMVITTYNIVSREHNATHKSGIYGVDWERIILDEAHVIRNHKSAMSEACCAMKGRNRWLLTGTPIQNKEMDMYALLKFLRCTPFDDLNHWKRWIDNKTSGGAIRLNTITKSILLRRTKKELQERGALNSLPPKTVELIEVQLEKDEMNVYQKVLLYSKTLFAQYLHQRAEKEQVAGFGGYGRPTFKAQRAPNAAFDMVHQKLKRMQNNDGAGEVQQHQILVLLLRLRQICCHPGLIQQMLSDDDQGNLEMSGVDEPSFDGAVDLLGQLNKLKLNDVIAEHEAKLAKGEGDGEEIKLNLSEEFDRPEAMSKALSKVMLKSNPVFRMERSSSKIEKVMQLLEEKIFGTDDKAIIVSQWTSMLEILGSHLSNRSIPYVSLTGKVQVKLRNDIVVEFNKPSGKSKIMLLSLTAGGVGLNLVGANHLFLLDPHWNPQLEAQAQDRVYRVGQTKPVNIWKFMCVDTVEQKIHALQQHKLGIADGVLTGTMNKGSKLTIDDLKSLFGL